MKKRKREKLEQKKAERGAEQLPQWLLQGDEQVEEHFQEFYCNHSGEIASIDEFNCRGCYHYLVGECGDMGYKGREVYECLRSHDCFIGV